MASPDLPSIILNVARILATDKDARSSDKRLLTLYYKKHSGIDIDFAELENPVSVIRCRRHIQKLNPQFKGVPEVEEERDAHSRIYQSFVKNNGGLLNL